MANKKKHHDEIISYEEAKARLANDLRRLRRTADLTGTEAAKRAGFSQSKISKLETTILVPSRTDVETLCSIYKAPKDEKSSLLHQVDVLENELNDWRTLMRTGARQLQDTHKEFESKASVIRVLQPTIVPGLLQTTEYARAILQARNHEPSIIEATVASRLERQSILYDPQKHFEFVILEAALRSPYGEYQTMLGQLDRLLTLGELPNISIRVIPLMQILPAVPLTQFVMLDDDYVTVETMTAEISVRDRRDLDSYRQTFDVFMRIGLNEKESTKLLREIAKGYRSNSHVSAVSA